MTRFDQNILATIDFSLSWESDGEKHEESFLGRRVNPWRDVFPNGLLEALQGAARGDAVRMEYGPGEFVPAYSDELVRELDRKAFTPRRIAGRAVRPRRGRFYPQGMLNGLLGVYPQTMTPFRILDLDDRRLVADCNHPLARHAVRLDAHIVEQQPKRKETGGQLTHWSEALTQWGPGMQATPAEGPVDFVGEGFFDRGDPGDDALFYAAPRMVDHVDRQASRNLRSIHSRFLSPGMHVLDLMSGSASHLPEGMPLCVTGLGMNAEEMERNPKLSRHVVHDLNHSPALPDGLGLFDVVTCSLSVEYLTRPVEVLRSVLDHLVPEGVLLVGFSNRWFPSKAVAGWLDLHEFERLALVRDFARRAGFRGSCGTITRRNDWRPADDPHFVETRGTSDPVFLLWIRP